MSPVVSIVMRTKDRALLLRRALASVASQTYDDYELIVVNDGGSIPAVDLEIRRLSEAEQRRVRVVNNTVSSGREAALEDGLRDAAGQYFAIHDDDDSWEPGFLQATVAYLDSHPEDAAVATRCDVIHEHVADGRIVTDGREILAPDRASWTLIDTLAVNYVPPISQLIRKKSADEVGHWSTSLETQADWDFNLRLQARFSVGFLPDVVLAHWHHRPPQGNTLGNSVVDASQQHQIDNLAVRDSYLRSDAHALSSAVVAAEYYRRLSDQLRRLQEERNGDRTAIDGLHANHHAILIQLQSAHDGLGAILDELSRQSAAIAELQGQQGLMRRAGARLVRAVHRKRRRSSR